MNRPVRTATTRPSGPASLPAGLRPTCHAESGRASPHPRKAPQEPERAHEAVERTLSFLPAGVQPVRGGAAWAAAAAVVSLVDGIVTRWDVLARAPLREM
ncbi:hypothetical protein GCM10009733_104150 [Nonomuraea maheshkhaliensis]|uniref:Uncharacterized protein n=1 Tax=Nonomuraea maheshkhaliensis TaxID=419590 RepID=A0ABP4TNQ7_9ACTN